RAPRVGGAHLVGLVAARLLVRRAEPAPRARVGGGLRASRVDRTWGAKVLSTRRVAPARSDPANALLEGRFGPLPRPPIPYAARHAFGAGRRRSADRGRRPRRC